MPLRDLAADLPDTPPEVAASWESRAPGTYLLSIHLDRDRTIQVGRLGQIAFRAGWYVYVGSALGGLGARLRRHARQEKPHHWHIDALRAVGTLAEVAVRPGAERIECAVAATVAALPGATQPVPRFGSSDCRCQTHLFHFAAAPGLQLDDSWVLLPLATQPHPAMTGNG